MSRWFRHYAGMMRDEKLVAAAVRSKQPVERVVWVWGAILESAAEINDGGRYEFDAGEVAYFLRCDEAELVRIVECLQDSGRLHDGVVARWSDRQFDSDASKDRQRRYRERRKAGNHLPERNGDVGEEKRYVTPPLRDGAVTPQEAETDTKISDASASGAVAPQSPRDVLWRDGVSILIAISGKTETAAKQMVGKWCRDTRDDCALILAKIQQAKADHIGEPISWISASLKPPDKPPKAQSIGEMFREDARQNGILNDKPPIDSAGRMEASNGSRQDGGVGGPRLFAITGDILGDIGQGRVLRRS